MKLYAFLSILLISIFLISCSGQLVYSPALNVPNKTLKKDDIDLAAGFEMLPRTRPGSEKNVLPGLSGQIGYGFADNFNLNVRGWWEIESYNGVKQGYSLTAQFIDPLTADKSLIFMPQAGIAFSGYTNGGYGFGFTTVFHHELTNNLAYYGGAGFLWGFRNLDDTETTYDGEEKVPMGFGIKGHLGLSWQFYKGFRLNAEFVPLYQINTFDGVNDLILSPQIAIAYTIR